MKVSPVQSLPIPVPPQSDPPQVRSEEELRPVPGSPPTAETGDPDQRTPTPANAQDEVKLQWDSQTRITIYKFLNEQGEVVLQVPSEQMINLAQEISEQLRQQAAQKNSAPQGGKHDGH